MTEDQIRSIIEAVLFSVSEPISIKQLRKLFSEHDLSARQVRDQIQKLADEYRELDRSFQLIEIANGFQIVTDPKFHEWIETFHTRYIKTKLSPAALEAIAIIAYKQPITRAEVEEIRGVNSDGVINNLLEKGLIKVSRRQSDETRAMRFETTDQFLESFGLKDLSELPTPDEIQQLLSENQDQIV